MKRPIKKTPDETRRASASGTFRPPARNGFPCFSRGAAALDAAAWREIRRGLKLSDRERQIIRGIFDDKHEGAIASGLGISIHTVRTRVGRLRRKLNAVDRVKMILCVMEEFLRQTTSAETTLPSICRQRAAGSCPLQGRGG